MVIMCFLDLYDRDNKYKLPYGGMGDAIKRCQFLGVFVSISICGFGTCWNQQEPIASPQHSTLLPIHEEQDEQWIFRQQSRWSHKLLYLSLYSHCSVQLTMEQYMAFYSQGTHDRSNNSTPANSLTIRTTQLITVREPLVPAHDAASSSVLIAMHSTNS
jgi:hypothetical protein